MPQHPLYAKSYFFLFLILAYFAKGQLGYQLPPKIISTFKNEYFYPRNSTLADASFNCTAQNGPIQYQWEKDGVVVQNSQYVSIDNSTGTLKFVKMQKGNYGTYQCFATNDNGTSLSKPFKVKEASLGSFPTSSIQEVQCKQYEHCIIPCRNKPRCAPESHCKVRWKIGEGTNTYAPINTRVAVDNNGDLHFLWTKPDDWTGLPYLCEVSHEQLNKPVVGSQTSLRIDKTSMALEIDPFSVFKEDGKALVGGRGVLRCMFSGYPIPDIQWTSPQETIIKNIPSKYEISDFGRVLTILQSTPENEGFYICLGKAKTESRPQIVSFNVTSAPALIGDNQMHDMTVTEGNNATFRCEAISLSDELPPTQPLWKKNGVDLDFDEEKYILTENSKSLTVIDVQKSDTGVYQCMSENSEGVLLKEAILNVIDPLRTDITTYNIATNIAYDNITTTGDTLTTTVKQTESQTVIYYIVVSVVVVLIIILILGCIVFQRKKKQSYILNEENNANQDDQEIQLGQTPPRPENNGLLNNPE
ncbi:neural cell adhesion molecule L1-like [Crassostrea angulata]|uniref:neural cell adhesion molecule L1-like n=1 Tax=Magallana angulata TaxID=2784310 RepID=UPI0022B11F13|nr:neural cell adhesion molecule L1-like [Crassostrea angulata]